ncbi:TIGR02285 family protein [Litorilituus lipolyticus]|nr:TIGR02285 family protein [Litorilituus lipolyticus]
MTPTISAQEGIIYWQTDHRPPASILHGPYQGQGFIDQIRDSLIENLNEYQHLTSISALDKLFHDMKLGKNICHPLLFVTKQRKQHAYFSIPVTITPSMRVVMTTKRANEQNIKEPIELKTLFKSGQIFATVKGRSYGAFIDEAIKQQKNNYSHAQMSAEDNTRLFRLLEKNRIDFTFAYPFELNYFQTYHQSTDFSSFTIKGLSEYTLGSVACSKTAWGKSVIGKVNKVLLKQRQQADFISRMNHWWPEETNKEAFKQFYRHDFLNAQ